MYNSSSQTFVDLSSSNSYISRLFLSTTGKNEREETNVFAVDQITKLIQENKMSDTTYNISPWTLADTFNKNNISNSYSHTQLHGNETEHTKINSIKQKTNNQEDKVDYLNADQTRTSFTENQTKEENESDENETSNNKVIHSGRFRGRKFGIKSCFNKSSTSFESTLENNQAQNFILNTSVSSSYTSTLPLSPKSTSSSESISVNSRHNPIGVLRRTFHDNRKKKSVRFADSIGRELEQVKYIQSLTNDDLTDFSLFNNKLYLPKLCNLEHKPWTFDVEYTSIQSPPVPIPKRYFCLYRQPNSDHPHVYFHNIWKNQLKLEYANMRLKSSLTGEQCLYGTVWVANSGYHKNVTIQYTFDRWLNKYEYEAKYCCHSNDSRNIDKFEFSIDISYDIDRVDFAVRYRVNGQENWDNNENQNYTLETESVYTPHTTISLPHDCNFDEMRFY